ncbi:MAG: F0F1 ATP synthase subunit epsilon [Flavobacteriaceae bacterium]|jgi:F-type H+-transporting ATPase subunit epsilon|nr:F0F1 ATP synthase subunit epsilon [Flavobacteriaceae bacterium]
MYLEIISPEATLFTGEVESLTLPGTNGSFQLLENHAPIVSTLQGGAVKIKGNITIAESVQNQFESISKEETLFTISSGTIEMRDNKIILLSD